VGANSLKNRMLETSDTRSGPDQQVATKPRGLSSTSFLGSLDSPQRDPLIANLQNDSLRSPSVANEQTFGSLAMFARESQLSQEYSKIRGSRRPFELATEARRFEKKVPRRRIMHSAESQEGHLHLAILNLESQAHLHLVSTLVSGTLGKPDGNSFSGCKVPACETPLDLSSTQQPISLGVAGQKLLEAFEGRVEWIEGDVAYVRLEDTQSRISYGEIDAKELAANGICDQDRFRCEIRSEKGRTILELKQIPAGHLTDKDYEAVEAYLDVAFPNSLIEDEEG